jgi:tRNA A-37 threonylcarbamoyl transferase component Bud32
MMRRTPVASEPAPPNPDIQPGTLLAGKYRVDRVIGRGGMGLVVAARHLALDERVALKFLLPDFATHPEAATRFLREAQAAVKIKSEHVARVSDVGTLGTGAPFMVMELLDGADLSKGPRDSVLLVHDAVDFIIQACEAIAEAHAHGIVHRDIKPANLFLTHRSDGSPLVKVLDFGISKMVSLEIEKLTKTSTVMGSMLYMSPEQMRASRAVDHRTDIYALGVSLYELLGGEQPFRGDTLPELCAEVLSGVPTPLLDLRPEVPEELVRVIEKAFARERGDRHPSVADFVIALAPFAPSRSQREIERICRMGGLAVATAGMPAAPGGNGVTAREALGVTAPLPAMPPARGSFDSAAGAQGMAATVPVKLPSGDGFAIERGPRPVAREINALEPDEPAPRRPRGWTVPVLVVFFLVGGAVAFAVLGRGAPVNERAAEMSQRPAASTPSPPATTATPPTPTSLPLPSATAQTVTTAAPSASAPAKLLPPHGAGHPRAQGAPGPVDEDGI